MLLYTKTFKAFESLGLHTQLSLSKILKRLSLYTQFYGWESVNWL